MIVVHVQDGLDTVIVEGAAAVETNPAEMGGLRKDYVHKYDYEPDWSDEQRQVVFRVTPKVAIAWRAPKMHRSYVRFLFQPKVSRVRPSTR